MGEYANKAIGKTKKTVGKLTGNRSLQAKGTVQQYAGKAEGVAKKVARKVKGAASGMRRNSSTRPPAKTRRVSASYSRY